jgi:hypothetical protein
MLVIWYVDAGNTGHSTLSNHLSSLPVATSPCRGPETNQVPRATQTAQQSSDIVNKNQLLMTNLSPDAACVLDPSHKSHEPRPFGVPPYSFCKSSLLMHVPS